MAVSKPNGKRTGAPVQRSSKKQKLSSKPSHSKPSTQSNGKTKAKGKGKGHAYERDIIPIPRAANSDTSDDDVELSVQDAELLNDEKAQFLQQLDERGISRSKKENERLWGKHKPRVRTVTRDDELPDIDSGGESDDWSSGIEGLEDDDDDESDASAPSASDDSDAEMPYETLPRKRRKSWEPEEKKGVSRLPVKLPNGQVKYSKDKVIPKGQESDSDSDSENDSDADDDGVQFRETSPKVEDVATGARFGRPAIADIMTNESPQMRVALAQQQISTIAQDIIGDPENGLGLLRRLHTFSLAEITTPSHPEPIPNMLIIRQLAIGSQLAVFKDIIPGYRIRPLTDKEKEDKVSQPVQRQRDFEQGLVRNYQVYLLALEQEIKDKTELEKLALKCICHLLGAVAHFNYRTNLIALVVAQLGRKSWTDLSDLSLSTLISVIRDDNDGEVSLEIVRLIYRMVKEKRFNVHPNVLSALLHLRLKTELDGIRASDSKANHADANNNTGHGQKKIFYKKGAKKNNRKAMAGVEEKHISKKEKKVLKELKEIKEEMREADVEASRKVRQTNQTETLKLVFALYFRVLKSSKRSPLLPMTLQGISRFTHLISLEFFKDVVNTLKELAGDSNVSTTKESKSKAEDELAEEAPDPEANIPDVDEIALRLQSIITAFELLRGQGETLVIDLADFVTQLYSLIPPLSVQTNIESPLPSFTPPPSAFALPSSAPKPATPASLLFRALSLVFDSGNKTSAARHAPAHRTAAFCKRLLTAALHFPTPTALQAIEFVYELLQNTSALEGMIPASEVAAEGGGGGAGGGGGGSGGIGVGGGGTYRGMLDDPELCAPFATVFWELDLLVRLHADETVVKCARRVMEFVRA